VLDDCTDWRRSTWLGIVNPVSVQNLERLRSTEQELVQEMELFYGESRNETDIPFQARKDSSYAARKFREGLNQNSPVVFEDCHYQPGI
jgi:hypothetical protein